MTSELTLNEYQGKALETALGLATGQRGDSPLDGLVYCALALCGEAGEFAEKVKKAWRDDNWEGTLADELGDVLWYLAVAADRLGWNLGDVAQRNVEKLASRKKRGVLQGSGDDR